MSERPKIPEFTLKDILRTYERNGDPVSNINPHELRDFVHDQLERGRGIVTPTMVALPAVKYTTKEDMLGQIMSAGIWWVYGNRGTITELSDGPDDGGWDHPYHPISLASGEVADILFKTWGADLSVVKVVDL